MKVNELAKDNNLTKIKVKLPESIFESYKNYLGAEPEMWIVGYMMGDFFLSPDAPSTKGNRILYPMPLGVIPKDILDWEVVENLN